MTRVESAPDNYSLLRSSFIRSSSDILCKYVQVVCDKSLVGVGSCTPGG